MEQHIINERPRRHIFIVLATGLGLLLVAVIGAGFVILFKATSPRFDKRILAIAIPPDAPHVSIRGTVYLPDGSPVTDCLVTADTVVFVLDTPNTYKEGLQGFGQHHIWQDGTFQLDSFRTGTNVVITAFGRDDGEHRHLVAQPIVFVAHENMEPLIVTLEEGIPVRGRLMYDNGSPATLHAFDIEQHIEPILGADIPAVRNAFRSSRQHEVNDVGEFEVFLLPGDYTFSPSAWKGQQTLTIAPTDTKKQFDIKIPTPIFVEAEMEDGTRIKNARSSFSSNVRAISSSCPMSEHFYDGTLLLEPVSHDWTLYLMDMEGEHGTIETITPAMVGKTMRFTLKPVGRVTLTVVDANGRPAAGKAVSLSIMQNTHTQSGDHAVTDSDGKVVLRVYPGKVSVSISVGSQRIDKKLDIPPGKNFDLGIVRLH
ncbi:MAG: Ig-like domain-containing protein [Planctomycetaceae bacterium]|nr:Ig-like domain-containing protein [Planctomycetaceae bacterium]